MKVLVIADAPDIVESVSLTLSMSWPEPAPHQAQVLYRLAPVPVGTRAEGEAVTAAAQPFPTLEPAGETLTLGVPRIAYRSCC